jgi:hypothetical protein
VSFLHKLQQRWGVKSTRSALIILVVFALTGTSVMLLKKYLQIHVFDNARWFTYTYYWLVLPFYNLLLLAYGYLFGHFNFFWEFEKKTFRRIAGLFKRNNDK